MTTWIALLRAVNIAGRNRVAMSDLRALCGELRLANARTLLQSGNLVFESAGAPATLARRLERATRETLGVETDFLLRSASEWNRLIADNPYPKEARADPGHLVVMVLAAAHSAQAVTSLRAAIRGRERIEARGAHLYAHYPDGIGRSKLTTAVIEKHLATRGTMRNWNTVAKLGGIAETAGDRS